MAPKQSTIGEIIESERTLILEAPERYGEFYRHAFAASVLFSNFVKSADATREIFLRFHSLAKKHHLLSLFSVVRLHKVQAMMDLRHTLEATACAAYAIANPDPEAFIDVTEDGLLDATQALRSKRYKWLAREFPAGSADLERVKGLISKSTAHANLISTAQNYEHDGKADWAQAPFFDIEDDHLLKTDLWFIANVAIGTTDLIFGVADANPGATIALSNDFVERHGELAGENARLKAAMMETERYKNAMSGKKSGDAKG